MPRKYLWMTIAFALLPTVVGIALLPRMPGAVPVHYGVSGQPDAYGSPRGLVAGCAALPVFVVALWLVIPRIGRMRESFARFGVAYGRLCVTVSGGMTAICLVLLLRAAGWNVPVHAMLMMLVGLMIAGAGACMGDLRRNPWVGIRTPWTLADDRVWDATNRPGAKLTIAYGLVIAAAGAAAPPLVSIAVLLVGAIVLIVWSMAYSRGIARSLAAGDGGAAK